MLISRYIYVVNNNVCFVVCTWYYLACVSDGLFWNLCKCCYNFPSGINKVPFSFFLYLNNILLCTLGTGDFSKVVLMEKNPQSWVSSQNKKCFFSCAVHFGDALQTLLIFIWAETMVKKPLYC